MADGPGGAARQLAVFERTGDLTAVARYLTGWHTPEPGPGVAGPAARDVAWAIAPGAPLPIAVG
jgi:hypothetical protein